MNFNQIDSRGGHGGETELIEGSHGSVQSLDRSPDFKKSTPATQFNIEKMN